MVHNRLSEKILRVLADKGPCSQKEMSNKLEKINRAILTGYLRCMADVGKIQSKDIGKAKVYLMKRGDI